MARKQPESEQPVELSPQDSHPERELQRAQWARVERQWEIADAHHEFGESVCKYGQVFHQGRTGQFFWIFTTELAQSVKMEDYDPHDMKSIAEYLDCLSRRIGPRDTLTIQVKVISMVPLPEKAIDESNNHHCGELQGVEHEN